MRKDLDFGPLCDVAQMLYGSALVCERYAGISEFLMQSDSQKRHSGIPDIGADDRLLPVTRSIINGAGAMLVVCGRVDATSVHAAVTLYMCKNAVHDRLMLRSNAQ